MGSRRLTSDTTGPGLLRQFAILSLVVIALISTGLSLVISHFLRQDLLEREWRIAAEYVRTEALYHLTPEDFAAPMTSQAREHFKRFYDQTVMMPEIIRVKIYDSTMAVVWSDEPRLIGRRFPDDPELVSALAGRTTVKLTEAKKPENVYERDATGHLVEVYVPIVFPGTERVAGVVETYKLPEQVFANIRRGQFIVAGTGAAGGVVLYLSLFWIVRRAARRIESQRALTAHLQAAQEEERSSMAREARDELAQLLSVLKIDLVWMAGELGEAHAALRAKTKEMLALVETAMASALRLASGARPGVLDNLGLVPALDWEARRFQSRTGIRCQFTSALTDVDLDQEERTVTFRILQETLTTIAAERHATRVDVHLTREAESLVLTVEDDGESVPEGESAAASSLALLGMRERATRLGGTIAVERVPRQGTALTVTIPLKRAAGQRQPGLHDEPERPAERTSE